MLILDVLPVFLRKLFTVMLFFALLGVFILPVCTVQAAGDVEPGFEALDDYIAATVDKYHIPGLAVAVVDSSGVMFEKGYGQVSAGEPVTAETPFMIGSVTKTFTALGVLQLVEAGQLDLDAAVTAYLPEFKLASDGSAEKITVRHLLNHRSGLTEACMPGMTWGEDSLAAELIPLRQCDPEFAPGEKYVYFNVNYRILGLLIERVSGVSYGEYLTQALFTPLAMDTTYAGPQGVERMVTGHGHFLGFPFKRRQVFRSGALPSGYLVTSASDLGRFLVEELRAMDGQSEVIFAETAALSWSPPDGEATGYGMGWLVIEDADYGRLLAHGGQLENFQSFILINPQTKMGFAILMNQGGLTASNPDFDAVRQGLLSFTAGNSLEGIINNQRPVVVVGLVFIAFLGLALFRTWRMKSWRSRSARYSLRRRWVSLGMDFLWGGFLLFGLYPLMNMITGDKADWMAIYGLLPELFVLLVLWIVLAFGRGLYKAWCLAGNNA